MAPAAGQKLSRIQAISIALASVVKIIHVIGVMDLAAGGPTVGTASFAGTQALAGHDVLIVCYDSPGNTAALQECRRLPGFDRVQVRVLPRHGKIEGITAIGAKKALKGIITPDSFVDIHGVWAPLLSGAVTVARAKKAPYAITPHGMLDPWSMRQKAWKKKPIWQWVWKDHCDHASFIRVLNADEVRLMKPLAVKAPMEIFPNGIFPESYAELPSPGEFRKQHAPLNERRFILFLSRLHFKKGLDYLIEAFAIVAARIPDVDLVIAGPDEGALEQLQRDIKRLNLASRVHIVGALYGRSKYEALVDAYCFCLPSRQEGFSNAIIEALASGTPVVISENCNFPEVGEVKAGYVVKLEAAATATALIALLQSPSSRDEAGRAGKALIFERFTWKASVDKWIRYVKQNEFLKGTGPGN